ncbi:MAG: hypothetical protein AB8B63_16325 [Granulosicoccus sp.]
MMIKSRMRCAIGCLAVFALSACENNVVPTDATLQITPDSSSYRILSSRDESSTCIVDPGMYMDVPLVIQLLTVNGTPIGDTAIRMHVELAQNSFPRRPVLALYKDVNSNGVIDQNDSLVSAESDAAAQLVTDQWTGSKTLLLRINLSCGYRARIHAIADGISGFSSVEVVEEHVDGPTGDNPLDEEPGE